MCGKRASHGQWRSSACRTNHNMYGYFESILQCVVGTVCIRIANHAYICIYNYVPYKLGIYAILRLCNLTVFRKTFSKQECDSYKNIRMDAISEGKKIT